MDRAALNTVLIVAAISILALSIGTLVRARPRRQVLIPFLTSLVVSSAIYLSTVNGASGFHTAVIISSLLAVDIALFLMWFEPARDKMATLSWALFGVVAPCLAFFMLLTAVCWGHSECFG